MENRTSYIVISHQCDSGKHKCFSPAYIGTQMLPNPSVQGHMHLLVQMQLWRDTANCVNQALQLSVTEPNCSTKNKLKLFCSSSTISKDNAVKKTLKLKSLAIPAHTGIAP